MPARSITIGLPTYNGERFLSTALSSLCAQQYERFDLVICDNASTDRTGEIAQELARRDPRVRYFRSEANRGALANFDWALELATGEYMMWASDHDEWAPGYLSKLAAVLDEEPEVVLAYGKTSYMNAEGRELEVPADRIDTRGLGPARRLGRFLGKVHWCNLIYGLHRTRVLRDMGPNRNVWAPDILMLSKLTLRGSFRQLDEVLFRRRENRPPESEVQLKERMLGMLHPDSAQARSGMSQTAFYRELRDAIIEEIAKSTLTRTQRVGAVAAALGQFQLRFGVAIGPAALWRSVTLAARTSA